MMLSYVSPNSACVFILRAVSFRSCTIVVSSSSSFFSAKKPPHKNCRDVRG